MDGSSHDDSLDQRNHLVEKMHSELHDLCQPLTALQVQLEVGKMLGDPVALRDAVDAGLEEVDRMARAIQRMRDRLTVEGGGRRDDALAAGQVGAEFGGHAPWQR